jgi:hypothetical protein
MYQSDLGAAHEHIRVQQHVISSLESKIQEIRDNELIMPLVLRRFLHVVAASVIVCSFGYYMCRLAIEHSHSTAWTAVVPFIQVMVFFVFVPYNITSICELTRKIRKRRRK